MAARKAEKLQRDEEGRQPEEPSATWEEAVDARPEVSRLFSNLKHSLPALEKLLDESSSHWGYYNTKRSGTFTLGGRGFQLRRVAFPPTPTPEWYVVDLFENFAQAGVSRSELTAALKRALAARRFDAHLLRETAERYATRATKALSPAAPR